MTPLESAYRCPLAIRILSLLLIASNSNAHADQQCLSPDSTNGACDSRLDANETIEYPMISNINELCDFWAGEGECGKNPNYMRSSCPRSCLLSDLEANSGQCTLYMAESSIPNSGWGMYTAAEIPEQTSIPQPEIVMNVVDYKQHRKMARMLKERNRRSIPEGVDIDRHNDCAHWASSGECDANPVYMRRNCQSSCFFQDADKDQDKPDKAMEEEEEEEEEEEDDIFWLPDNYYWDSDSPGTSNEGVDVESLIPGVGALANSHTGLINTEMQTAKVDGAGLLRHRDPGAGAISPYHSMSYTARKTIQPGEEIFAEYGDNWFAVREEKFGPLPLSDDFLQGDKMLDKFSEVITDGNSQFAHDLLSFTNELTNSNKRIRMIIPDSMEELKSIQKVGGAAMYSVPNVIRPLEWLEENGICLDNIIASQSSIPEAGRGAFATRPIRIGQIIAPAPLMHIHREHLKMYRKGNSVEGIIPIGEQLIRNYSFGHVDSPVLFFSYGVAVNFINHNSDAHLVNAKIQWASEGRTKAEWMNLSLEQLFEKETAGIMLEFVATRNINVGEEIFIDYGTAWQTAWEKHVSQWKEEEEGDYVYDLDELNKTSTELLSVSEQRSAPYPPNAMTLCYITPEIWDSEESEVDFDDYGTNTELDIRESIRCEISDVLLGEEEDEDEFYYTVNLRRTSNPKEMKQVINVPRKFIKFEHEPYSRDYALPSRFRHEIGIPDGIFPQQWRQQEVK